MENFGLPGHEGVDYGGKEGDLVFAAADGVVKLIAKDDGKHPYGNQIRLTHKSGPDTFETIYAHLRGFVSELKQGDTVKAGQQIGTLGSTGNSTGPHLHFSVKKNGALVNPAQFLKP
jgi:murein DD-endopeptidase MepM/ murein hydrolase activator NlpD